MDQRTIDTLRLVESLSVLTARAQSKDIPDGIYYEDGHFIVEKRDGIVTTSGKPMREVLIHGRF